MWRNPSISSGTLSFNWRVLLWPQSEITLEDKVLFHCKYQIPFPFQGAGPSLFLVGIFRSDALTPVNSSASAPRHMNTRHSLSTNLSSVFELTIVVAASTFSSKVWSPRITDLSHTNLNNTISAWGGMSSRNCSWVGRNYGSWRGISWCSRSCLCRGIGLRRARSMRFRYWKAYF